MNNAHEQGARLNHCSWLWFCFLPGLRTGITTSCCYDGSLKSGAVNFIGLLDANWWTCFVGTSWMWTLWICMWIRTHSTDLIDSTWSTIHLVNPDWERSSSSRSNFWPTSKCQSWIPIDSGILPLHDSDLSDIAVFTWHVSNLSNWKIER